MQGLLGFLQCVTQLDKLLRLWLCSLCADWVGTPFSHLSKHRSLGKSSLPSDDAVVLKDPPGTALPVGGKLLGVRNADVKSKADAVRAKFEATRLDARNGSSLLKAALLKSIQDHISGFAGVDSHRCTDRSGRLVG